MTVKISSDEWYPVYSAVQDPEDDYMADFAVELSESELEQFYESFRAFMKFQDLIVQRRKASITA